MQHIDLAVDLLTVFTILLAVDKGIGHEQDADQDAGNDTCQEEVTDRGTGRHGEHDEGNAGRDDNAQAACDGDDGGRKDLIISHIDQKRDRHGTDCRDGRRGRARDRAVEQAGDDDRTGNTCGTFSKEIGKDIEQTLGDLSACHEDARKDEHRNRQKRETVDTAHHGTDDITCTRRKGRIKRARKHCDKAQCDRDRDRDQQKERKQNKYNNR